MDVVSAARRYLIKQNGTECARQLREGTAKCIEVINAKANEAVRQIFGTYKDANTKGKIHRV